MNSNGINLHSGKMDWSVFRLRERVLRTVRDFFNALGFLEIESPLLTPFPTLDSNIHPFRTRFSDAAGKTLEMYLHTSPEYSMKKMLAAGSGNIYFIGKVFRDREQTAFHNPEFTMVEWYRLNADYRDIQQDTEDLIRFVLKGVIETDRFAYSGKTVDLSGPWHRISVYELFLNRTGIDLDLCPDVVSLSASAKRIGIRTQPGDDWETVFFRIFLEKIEPGLGFPKPVFIMDYPVRMGLMAKRKESDPEWTERTELYMAGLELANGYTELSDPDEQRSRFEAEQMKKRDKEFVFYPVDHELLRSLEFGLPPCAGMALGLDRLIMLLADKHDIQDVLSFPVHRWMQ